MVSGSFEDRVDAPTLGCDGGAFRGGDDGAVEAAGDAIGCSIGGAASCARALPSADAGATARERTRGGCSPAAFGTFTTRGVTTGLGVAVGVGVGVGSPNKRNRSGITPGIGCGVGTGAGATCACAPESGAPSANSANGIVARLTPWW